MARDMIAQVVADHSHGAKRDVHDDCIKMSIPRKCVRHVIGDQGNTIYRIEQTTRTKIVVHQSQGDTKLDQPTNKDCVTISISGKVAAVQAAKAAIDALIQKKSS